VLDSTRCINKADYTATIMMSILSVMTFLTVLMDPIQHRPFAKYLSQGICKSYIPVYFRVESTVETTSEIRHTQELDKIMETLQTLYTFLY
jgi:hypothetical protein